MKISFVLLLFLSGKEQNLNVRDVRLKSGKRYLLYFPFIFILEHFRKKMTIKSNAIAMKINSHLF